MYRKTFRMLTGAMIALLCMMTTAKAQIMKNADGSLNTRQEKIVTIAAFTACGDMPKLKTALNAGLDAGLTVNEIREVLIQMYAYTGFPRSLNSIQTFMTVMNEREQKGILDPVGKSPAVLPPGTDRDAYGEAVRMKLSGITTLPPKSGYQLFAPGIDAFLKEHLFADIFSRGVLDYPDRELATIAALSALTGTEGQLLYHLNAGLNVGLTQAQMAGLIRVLQTDVSESASDRARSVYETLLRNRSNNKG